MTLDVEKLLEVSHIRNRPSKNRRRRCYRLIKAWNKNLGKAQNGVSQLRDSFLRRSSRIIGEAAGLLQPKPSSPEPIYIPFPGYQTQVILKRAKLPKYQNFSMGLVAFFNTANSRLPPCNFCNFCFFSRSYGSTTH